MTLDPGEESSDRQFSQNQQLYLGTFFIIRYFPPLGVFMMA
jgi:hypothetical protein